MPKRIFSDDQEKQFVEIYNDGHSIREISQMFNCSPNGMRYILRKHGVDTGSRYIRRNLFNFDTQSFDNIETEAQAYWLGFIYADGHVRQKPPTLIINLQCSDSPHLEKLRNFLKAEYVVRHNTLVKNEKIYERCTLALTNAHFINTLNEVGLKSGKTDINLVASHISSTLMPHFFRGFFDGDGCARKREPEISIVGSFKTIEWVRFQLSMNIDSNPNKKLHAVKKSPGIFTISYCGRHQVSLLYKWMYTNATVYLERKRKIIEDYF